ncbi:MAG: DUF6933 domain-containing protein [Cyclobacteriaceae bacterium]
MKNEITIGITKRLKDQININFLNTIEKYSPVLWTWHAGLRVISRKKCILFTNDLTLYSFLVYGVKKKDFEDFPALFKENLIQNLESENLTQQEIEIIISNSDKISLTKTSNRSVLGSLNEFYRLIPFYIQNGFNNNTDQKSIIGLNKKLNRTPMQCTKKGFYPIDKLKETVRNFGA